MDYFGPNLAAPYILGNWSQDKKKDQAPVKAELEPEAPAWASSCPEERYQVFTRERETHTAVIRSSGMVVCVHFKLLLDPGLCW